MTEQNGFKNMIGFLVTNGFYEFQRARISFINQMRVLIRKKLEGIGFNELEKKKDKTKVKPLSKYTDRQLIKVWNEASTQNIMKQEERDWILDMWGNAQNMIKLERDLKKQMNDFVEGEEIYNKFLSKIRGIGEILSANLIKEFGDCSKYDTVSKLWSHTGNSVINGKAPSKKKGETLNFSPRLRTFTWKISDSLMKSNKGYYRNIYDTHKAKHLAREYAIGELAKNFKGYKDTDTKLSKGHANNRALRKVRKIFLDHYWHCAREIANLPAKKSYIEGVLGHKNYVDWKKAIAME